VIGSAFLLWAAPALAAGTFIYPGAGFTNTEWSELTEVAQTRVLFVEDGEDTVVAFQASAELVEGGVAWLIPLPGNPTSVPVAFDQVLYERLLTATDPLMPVAGVCGCGPAPGCDGLRSLDSGAGALGEISTFGENVRSGSRAWFGPEGAVAALDELTYNGLVVEPELRDAVAGYAQEGWGLLVIRLSEPDGVDANATPFVAVRIAGNAAVAPMLLSARGSAPVMQTVVLHFASQKTSPEDAKTTQVLLGLPLYAPRYTALFYEARIQQAVEEAGGNAWVLEYAGGAVDLQERYQSIAGEGERELSLTEGTFDPVSVDELFTQLTDAGVLSAQPDMEQLQVTRWRSFFEKGSTTDQWFVPDPQVPDLEIVISAENDGPRWEFFGLPLVLGLGAWARRRPSARGPQQNT
jgi:hypothetical protein